MSKEVNRYNPLIVLARNAKLQRMDIRCDPQWVLDLAAERDALLAERDRLAEALKALRAATPSLTCESFHHERRDLHGHDEECPPFERWIAAALACNAALQGEQP